MAVNFNHPNPISLVGLGLGDETTDVRLLLSSSYSNLGLNHVSDGGSLIDSSLGLGQLGLILHGVTEVKKTYVSPKRSVQVHSVIDYVPVQNWPAFPLSEVTTVTEVVKTTRFLSSTSTMARMFDSSPRVSNQDTFPTSGVHIQTQPAVMSNQSYQVMNLLRAKNPSMNREVLNILNHNNHVNVERETVLDHISAYSHEHPSYNQGLSFDQTAIISRNLDFLNKSNFNMIVDRGASYLNPVSSQVRDPNPLGSQPSFHSSFEKVSSKNDYDYTLGYDGRTHSLPDYPEGVYGCPKCFATFYTSQSFAAHIQTHYRQESKEERRRRMAAKCRRRNLRLVRLSHPLTAVPESKGIAKGYAARRKSDIAVKVHRGLDLGAAMKGPFMVSTNRKSYL